MITGIGVFFSIFWVCALNALQNSMMLRPRWPSAGPIGGARRDLQFEESSDFFRHVFNSCSGADLDGWRPPHLPRRYVSPVRAAATFSGSYAACPACARTRAPCRIRPGANRLPQTAERPGHDGLSAPFPKRLIVQAAMDV